MNEQLRPPRTLSVNSLIPNKNYYPNTYKRQLNSPRNTKLPSIYQSKSQLNQSQFLRFKSYPASLTKKPKINPLFYTFLTQAGLYGTGLSKINQDSNFHALGQLPHFGVCDGHGQFGHEVSQFVSELISLKIEQLSFMNEDQLKHQLQQIFYETQQTLVKNGNINSSLSGTTCVTVCLTYDCFYCANVGDSRAVYFYKTLTADNQPYWNSKPLSHDHKLDRPCEFQRIIANNGRVHKKEYNGRKMGPFRVWLQDENTPGLAMSRSFGDNVAKRVGVTAEPEIVLYKPSKPGYIVVGSDGFWDQMDSKSIELILNDCPTPSNQSDVNKLTQRLLDRAIRNWDIDSSGRDDITIFLIYVQLI